MLTRIAVTKLSDAATQKVREMTKTYNVILKTYTFQLKMFKRYY